MNLWTGLLAPLARSAVGLDLAPDGWKLVAVRPGRRGLTVTRHRRLPPPATPDEERAAWDAVAHFRGGASALSVVVPARALGLRALTLPTRDPGELSGVLPFLLSQLTSVPRDELACAALVTGEAPPYRALGVWTRRAGLPGAGRVAIEHAQPAPTADLIFARTWGGLSGGQVVLVDVGLASTTVTLAAGTEIHFARELALGRRDLEGSPPDAVERFAGELRACFQRAYLTVEPGPVRPERVLLTGDAPAGLAAALTAALGLAVEPLAAAVPGLPAGDTAHFAAALGAAAAPFVGGALDLDLAPPVSADRGVGLDEVPRLATALFVLALAVLSLTLMGRVADLEQQCQRAEQELRQLWKARAPDAAALALLDRELPRAVSAKPGEPDSFRALAAHLAQLQESTTATRVLEALEQALRGDSSEEAIVLTRLRLADGHELDLEGTAPTYRAVTNLLPRLEGAGPLFAPQLGSCSAEPPPLRFRVDMSVRSSQP